MIRVLYMLCVLWPATLSAQDLPALYSVTGVAQNDTLNVRSAPSASAEIIGTLAPNATDIEITATSENGKWARLNAGERSGWAAHAFLTENKPAAPITACFGTEPFWTLKTKDGESWRWITPETDSPDAVQLAAPIPSQNRTDRFALTGNFADFEGPVTAIVHRTTCSDGMSDRLYGLGIDLLLTDSGTPILLSGCCTVAP
ncbi:SH3 domain-containing protein [Sulfitobacter albidus]|uniref:SH3 domain-containing protein n=1 Tax=Sulfitobacter albidus TaxID=2829501 RepID=A0A975PLV7_9RHOB|nr:SH3 domain-containing protein [Sulfitobacter albidus]QUJ76143.1 SH3 domain-containing protein [Sulfitobacter albidus]